MNSSISSGVVLLCRYCHIHIIFLQYESVVIEMILSNQSSIDVVVQVTSSDVQAIGKY